MNSLFFCDEHYSPQCGASGRIARKKSLGLANGGCSLTILLILAAADELFFCRIFWHFAAAVSQ
jgi:hypothetical protein